MPFIYNMKWLKKIFHKNIPEKIIPVTNLKTIVEIKQFDDVWIKIDDFIYEGWVVNNEDNNIYIVYTDKNNKLQDIVFKIERPLNRTILENNRKVLILNKSEAV